MQPESLPSTGLMFTESEMSELAERTTSQPLTSLQGASPAKILAMLDAALDFQEIEAAYGLSSPESFASFDPDTCLWKTFQPSLHGESMPYLGRWYRSGMTQNGTAYRLPPLASM